MKIYGELVSITNNRAAVNAALKAIKAEAPVEAPKAEAPKQPTLGDAWEKYADGVGEMLAGADPKRLRRSRELSVRKAFMRGFTLWGEVASATGCGTYSVCVSLERREMRCTCEDSAKGENCKHALAVLERFANANRKEA